MYISELKAGDRISLATLADLRSFEDLVAGEIRPDLDIHAWSTRNDIDELIRPKVKGNTFHGRITDIDLTVMDEPYERLVDAVERGLSFTKKGGRGGAQSRLTTDNSIQSLSLYRGYYVRANAHSSGHGVVGQISTEMWIYPITTRVQKAGTVKKELRTTSDGTQYEYTYTLKKDSASVPSLDQLGRTVNRVVAVPSYNAEAFVELNTMSREIGLRLLTAALRKPIVTPMQN